MKQESHILKHADDRVEAFRPNRKLDALISRLSVLLTPAQKRANEDFNTPRFPVVAVLGCPRSGTTFLTQLLAASGQFSYPSNVLSRFAYAPYIGALIQKMLFDPDYDLRGEFSELRSTSGFNSDIGKTDGALGVNEFFHFWRRFFPNHDPGHLTDAELNAVDIIGMRRELAAIESVFERPFISKAMMLQYNASYFAERMPELFFIHIRREPKFVMQSITQSRRKYYGGEDIWWSVKPREYSFLKDMEPAAQVAGQVLFTEKAIDEQLDVIDGSRKLSCRYEDLCADPARVFEQLWSALRNHGVDLDAVPLLNSFPCQNRIRLSNEELSTLQRLYDNLKASFSEKSS